MARRTESPRLDAAVADGSLASYLEAARLLRTGAFELEGLRPFRLAIARSFTIQPIVPFLEVEGALAGLRVEIHLGEYNAFRQEILDRSSALYRAEPDAVLLALGTNELAPALANDFLTLNEDDLDRECERAVLDLRSLLLALRERTPATIILQTLVAPAYPAAGLADARLRPGQRETFERLNRAIGALADELSGVEVFDLDAHVADVGRRRWEERRLETLARAPIRAEHLPSLAREYAKVLGLIAGLQRKCVIVDLDDTLWGGVLGEDGVAGVQLGADYPGSAFVAFQRALLDLRRRGVVLAIASKNEQQDVDRIFAERRELVLRREDFVATRVNWRDKATNVSEIVAELGFAPQAFVFIDDNPVERALVARTVPGLCVPDWPTEPADYVDALRQIPGLETLRITAEDRYRTEAYAGETRRAAVRQTSGSLEDFFASLGMQVAIEPVARATRARFAQLTQKSTQFNLTLRPYTESEVDELARTTDCELVVLSLWDQFGDSGQVAVASLAYAGDLARIENIVMSCRVLGRGVETALLADLADRARRRGARVLEGLFVPGPRNAQAQDLYERHGFSAVPGRDGCWRLDLDRAVIAAPSWIQRADGRTRRSA